MKELPKNPNEEGGEEQKVGPKYVGEEQENCLEEPPDGPPAWPQVWQRTLCVGFLLLLPHAAVVTVGGLFVD